MILRRGRQHRPTPTIATVDHFQVVEGISVRGATEKDVLRDPETGRVYIAKLGNRNNDLEVITEYLFVSADICQCDARK